MLKRKATNLWIAIIGLFLLSAAACGGADNPTTVPPTEATNRGNTTIAPTFGFMETSSRLNLPTATVVAVPDTTPEMTASAPQLRTPGPLPTATIAPTPEPASPFTVSVDPDVEDVLASIYVQPDCITDYRNRIIAYDAPEEFGGNTAQRLWDEMLEERQDCAEQGLTATLAPDEEFVCYTVKFLTTKSGGQRIRHDGNWKNVFDVTHIRFDPNDEERWRADIEADVGEEDTSPPEIEVYLNFSNMPGMNEPGCWFYRNENLGGDWQWRVADGEGTGIVGRDAYYSPVCDYLLREAISQTATEKGEFGPAHVMEAYDRVKEFGTIAECNYHYNYPTTLANRHNWVYFWQVNPVTDPSPDCAVQSSTGVAATGDLVANWNPDPEYLGGDKTVCWVRYAESGRWAGYDGNGNEVQLFDLRDYVDLENGVLPTP